MFPRALGGGLAASLALLPLAAWSQQTDTTPPSPGTVWDGIGIDRDELDYAGILQADWGQSPRFSDPESDIIAYSIGVGTRPCSTEVHAYKSVGLILSYTLFDLNLIPGQRYYVTIRATNGAGLATHVSSDGVLILPKDGNTDGAPAPLPGGECTPGGPIPTPDAGSDGGAPDTPPDAGSPPDAGISPDAGTPDDGGTLEAPLGWGCTTGGPGGLAMMALSVLGLVIRLRRVRPR
ncbi:fibronectin type III domain-containing protein [Cystobacter ferrugineus]|uniref:fibronectin type III domain-containing protein n=1 Tax=Cystobacter ferrugineus TaxID=83449 RepID=UPI0011614344|nr:fibronectin type III domain-containing protein [Cystobacter ferrugineus]